MNHQALSELRRQALAAELKGLPQRAVGKSIDELGGLGLSVTRGDMLFPVAVLKESALAHNSAWMNAFLRRAGVSLCPHGKTTMAPQLFARQLADGCWGITAATASHLRTYRKYGVPRILLANQLVDRAGIELLLDELAADPAFDAYVLIDSIAGLRLLAAEAARRGLQRPVQVLLEVGAEGGRTGVRTLEQGLELGRAIRDAQAFIALRGVETFEGIFGGPDQAQIELRVLAMLDLVAALARTGVEEDWFAPGELILSAGGSAFFDMAAKVLAAVDARRELRIVLRSGCYLTHDALFYERMQARMRQRSTALYGPGPGLRSALEVWTVVQSIPEPGRAICAMGKRDVSFDMDMPLALHWLRPDVHADPQAAPAGLRITALNDQHAYVDTSACELELQVGDRLGFGISHPCTTFDKWPLLYLVDDDYRVLSGVRTFF
ncbi:alanine racemase [Roseateles violae]|uniref:Alanine racemase n=1 Tax=Roseateles violae TaxID=3058042 RepID=A0ABT8E058_9BURK|nr:alanine racemase [Pelomonas sp. PFR6]MDN3923188.1 alanine racemase [Pelomonas sp. PFR6]